MAVASLHNGVVWRTNYNVKEGIPMYGINDYSALFIGKQIVNDRINEARKDYEGETIIQILRTVKISFPVFKRTEKLCCA